MGLTRCYKTEVFFYIYLGKNQVICYKNSTTTPIFYHYDVIRIASAPSKLHCTVAPPSECNSMNLCGLKWLLLEVLEPPLTVFTWTWYGINILRCSTIQWRKVFCFRWCRHWFYYWIVVRVIVLFYVHLFYFLFLVFFCVLLYDFIINK